MAADPSPVPLSTTTGSAASETRVMPVLAPAITASCSAGGVSRSSRTTVAVRVAQRLDALPGEERDGHALRDGEREQQQRRELARSSARASSALHVAGEPIAAAPHGGDQRRVLGVALDLAPQPAHLVLAVARGGGSHSPEGRHGRFGLGLDHHSERAVQGLSLDVPSRDPHQIPVRVGVGGFRHPGEPEIDPFGRKHVQQPNPVATGHACAQVTTTTFDSFAAMRALEAAGVDRNQVEAQEVPVHPPTCPAPCKAQGIAPRYTVNEFGDGTRVCGLDRARTRKAPARKQDG